MEIAHVTVALNGDAGNTVVKYDCTASEIAVLRFIHGDDSVSEIEPVGEITRNNREERARLLENYGISQDGRFTSPAVDALFPGAAAAVFHTIDELGLDDSQYKAEARMKAPERTVAKPVAVPAAKKPTKAQLAAEAKAKADEQTEAGPVDGEATTSDEGEDDGIGDMSDDILS